MRRALFLHRRLSKLCRRRSADDRRVCIRPSTVLAGKKVLIVDDDIRNIFAMTSILEPHKMQILSAETGKAAIEILQNTPDIDVGADGHHDAGHGRVRHDAGDPQAGQIPGAADHRADRQGDEGRPGEMHRSRRFGLYLQAGGYTSSCCRSCGSGCTDEQRAANGRRDGMH